MTNTILLLVLIIGVAYIYFQKRRIADGRALWWATVSEPLHYVSDDPDDTDVVERARDARNKLELYGNKYLRGEDVWEYCYAATPETPTRDFAAWQDWVQLDILKKRQMWRQQKAQWNQDAAKQQFGGQTISGQSTVNTTN